jgi:hypothetical protein
LFVRLYAVLYAGLLVCLHECMFVCCNGELVGGEVGNENSRFTCLLFGVLMSDCDCVIWVIVTVTVICVKCNVKL